MKIGDNSWIGDNVYLYSLDNIIIGDNCVISQNTYINTGGHSISDSTFDLITKEVHILDGSWVGANCFVNFGVVINENVVIGAMSNVTKDLPANSICHGNPCKKVKTRIFNYEKKCE